MEFPRFYCGDNGPTELVANAEFSPPADVCRHLSRVLRLRPGDTVDIFTADNTEWRCHITQADKQQVTLQLQHPVQRQSESPFKSIILQAVSRGDRMDYTVQKATELGMTEFYPVLTERVGVKLDTKRWAKKVQHWQGVAISACEQSGRQQVPTIHHPLPFKEAIRTIQDDVITTHRLMLEIGAQQSLAQQLTEKLGSLALLIGPEGDFTAHEIALAQQAGFNGIHIGPRVLRTETVAPTVLAVAQALIGDWQ